LLGLDLVAAILAVARKGLNYRVVLLGQIAHRVGEKKMSKPQGVLIYETQQSACYNRHARYIHVSGLSESEVRRPIGNEEPYPLPIIWRHRPMQILLVSGETLLSVADESVASAR